MRLVDDYEVHAPMLTQVVRFGEHGFETRVTDEFGVLRKKKATVGEYQHPRTLLRRLLRYFAHYVRLSRTARQHGAHALVLAQFRADAVVDLPLVIAQAHTSSSTFVRS